jgi:hypothetical protein
MRFGLMVRHIGVSMVLMIGLVVCALVSNRLNRKQLPPR